MSVEIIEVFSKRERKQFVNFPYTLYKNASMWVPPIKIEEKNALIPEKNPCMCYCDTQLWIARKDGKCVGRIAGIINKLHNQKTGDKMARISRFEFIDNDEVADKLLETAEAWARHKGMDGVHGPLGFSNLDHQGMLIEGFEHLPSIASEYHLPYYQKHIERNGYKKEMDWVEFRLDLRDYPIPDKVLRVNEIVKKRYNLRPVNFNSTAEMDAYGPRIFELLNVAFKDLFSVVEFSRETADYYLGKYVPVLNPKFVKVMEDEDGTLLGFIIALPSLSEALQKAGGHVLPTGIFHIRKALKSPKVCDLLLTAVHPDWQRKGLVSLLFTELLQEMKVNKVDFLETTGMLETNHKAIQNWKNFNHIQHKRKRCYIKIF